MIKNIIFDLGNVLINFDPNLFIERLGVSDENDKKILMREVYQSVEWSMMDRGTITDEEGAEIMSKRVPEHLTEYVRKLTCEWDRPIIPVEGMYELVKELKENGYNLYLLSNASVNHKKYWQDVPGSEFFCGALVSSSIHYLKPQPEIYQCLLDKFNLKKEECIFIDDAIINIEGSEHFGIKGIVFHNDSKELRRKLIDNGININLEI